MRASRAVFASTEAAAMLREAESPRMMEVGKCQFQVQQGIDQQMLWRLGKLCQGACHGQTSRWDNANRVNFLRAGKAHRPGSGVRFDLLGPVFPLTGGHLLGIAHALQLLEMFGSGGG